MQLRFISITILTALLIGIYSLFPGTAIAQTPGEDNLTVYVWEFSMQNNDEKTTANRLTEDFETEVINSGLYHVIEVRELSRVEEQREFQEIIYDVTELSDKQIDGLEQNQAEAVFFGKLIFDAGSSEYIVEVKLQHLDGTLLNKKSILVNPVDLLKNEDRQRHMKNLFYQLHEDIYREQKKEQYDRISSLLNQYLMRAKDLTTHFRRLEFTLEDEAYLYDYQNAIAAYQETITDFLENQTVYVSNFRETWGAEMGEELSQVFYTVIEDFHKPYIFESLNRINEKLEEFYKLASSNKRKSDAVREEILERRAILLTNTDSHLGKVELSILSFLKELQEQLK
jgi:hypothetical protein